MSDTGSSRSATSRHGGGGGSGSLGGAGGVGYDGQGSPVLYRVGPLAYEPAVKCRCNEKACRWTSWSIAQPGRRYYRCRKAKSEGDCGFFKWVDDEPSVWMKELLGDLRDTVWAVKADVRKKEEQLHAKDLVLQAMEMELEEKKEVEYKQVLLNNMQVEVNAKVQQVQAKDEALQALQETVNNKNQCIDVLVVLSLLLLIFLVVILLNGKKA